MERNNRRTIQGVVISNKNDKTICVLVETHKKHPKYGKRVKYRKKYYAHDENNEAQVGDLVTIMETRRLSASKNWRLVSIDKVAESLTKEVKEAEEQLEKEATEEVEAPAEKPAEEKEEVAEENKEAE